MGLGDAQDVGLFLTLVFVLVTWRWIGCGLILYLSVFIGDLKMDSMFIVS